MLLQLISDMDDLGDTTGVGEDMVVTVDAIGEEDGVAADTTEEVGAVGEDFMDKPFLCFSSHVVFDIQCFLNTRHSFLYFIKIVNSTSFFVKNTHIRNK